ncbi:polysaccharide biosynthesis protein [Actinopolymorpha pittospori]
MKDQLESALRRRRVMVLALFDGGAWLVSIATFTTLRLDLGGERLEWRQTIAVGAAAAILQATFGWVVRLHHGRAALGSFAEALLLGAVTASVGLSITLANAILTNPLVPRLVPVAATFMTLALAAWGRATWRRIHEKDVALQPDAGSRKALILGAGDGARQLVDSMLGDAARSWHPVGLLDDDRCKRHRRLRGVPVLGTSEDLARAVHETGCRTLIVAIPSAQAELIGAVGRRARELGIELKVLPGVAELLDGRVAISDIRDIEVADLLGRRQIDTDVASIAGYLTGRRVLVTGAGGSIGSELCRQIYRFAPAELIMLDRDESALHGVQLSIYGRAMLDSPDVVLADIRDSRRIMELFAQRRPQVVFHAAALKHLPMLQQYPCEAVKTNVWGTLSVLEAAMASGLERFVNISTDKAANPSSVLGYSKRIAEGLTSSVAMEADGTFVSVRFGNVLGSRGSVLTSFAAQIEAGGPLTVTHPEVTRYFMTVQEAVQLVIQAGAIGRDGEALILDMGSPVRIADVAKQLVELSGRTVQVIYTGMRPGEKLHEELFSIGEPDHRPTHPLVSHVAVPPVDPAMARNLDTSGEPQEVACALREVCARMGSGVVWSAAAVSSIRA